MLQSARRSLANLKPIATQLKAATDDFSGDLETIEDELGKLRLGLDVELPRPLQEGDLEYDEDEMGEVHEIYRESNYLGYGRNGSSWQLLVINRRLEESQDGRIIKSVVTGRRPLLGSSREMRMAAVDQILDLLQLIESEAKAKLDSLSKAVDQKFELRRVDGVADLPPKSKGKFKVRLHGYLRSDPTFLEDRLRLALFTHYGASKEGVAIRSGMKIGETIGTLLTELAASNRRLTVRGPWPISIVSGSGPPPPLEHLHNPQSHDRVDFYVEEDGQ